MIIKGMTVYSVSVQRICIEVSIQIRYVLFSHQWISTTSTKFTISPPPVKRFSKIRSLHAGKSMLSAFFSTNTMISCLNGVSELSQYFSSLS